MYDNIVEQIRCKDERIRELELALKATTKELERYKAYMKILRTRCYPGAEEYFDNKQFTVLSIKLPEKKPRTNSEIEKSRTSV